MIDERTARTKAYWELITNDEDQVGFTTNTHPTALFHLLDDHVLQLQLAILELLWPKTPKQWIPVEDDAVLFIERVVCKQHRVQRDHE